MVKTRDNVKTGLFYALLAILLVTGLASGASGQTYTDLDTDGDGIPDRYDEYPYDRDNDGIPDDRDEYPDDPYNRDTTDDYDREEYDNQTATGEAAGDSSDGDGPEELCCIASLWWVWVIAGCLALFCDYRGVFMLYRKGVLGFIGGCMIVYGFWLGGFL